MKIGDAVMLTIVIFFTGVLTAKVFGLRAFIGYVVCFFLAWGLNVWQARKKKFNSDGWQDLESVFREKSKSFKAPIVPMEGKK